MAQEHQQHFNSPYPIVNWTDSDYDLFTKAHAVTL